MIARQLLLLSAGLATLVLAACADPATERIRTRDAMLADFDRHVPRPEQSSASPMEEEPLFRIDPEGPPAAMTADTDRRPPLPEEPISLTEEPRRR